MLHFDYLTEEVTRNDYNPSPSRYLATEEQEPALPLDEALVLLWP